MKKLFMLVSVVCCFLMFSGVFALDKIWYEYAFKMQAVDSQYDSIWIEPTDSKLQVILGSTSTAIVKTNITFIDTSKWYHICVNVDTTQATDTDRIKIWVDGDFTGVKQITR